MMRWLVAAVLVASLCGCKLLEQPVLFQGPVGPDGVVPPPVPVLEADGTEYTVAEYIADQMQEQAEPVGGIFSGALSGPLGQFAGLVAAVLVGAALAASSTLLKRFPGKPVEDDTEAS